jgi:hypothetical protein
MILVVFHSMHIIAKSPRLRISRSSVRVLLSPLRGAFAAPNRPWYSLLIPKLQLPLQPFLSRGGFAAPFIFSHSSAFQPQ